MSTSIESLSFSLGLYTLPAHAYQLLGAFASYTLISQFLSPLLSSTFFPSIYNPLNRRTKINWDLRTTSFIQAALINSLALYTILVTDADLRTDSDWRVRIWSYTPGAGLVQAFAAGYFLWDIWTSSIYLSVVGPGALVHAIAALIITMLGFRPFANYYGLNFILYELSTPFLNIHWFLDKLGMTGGMLQLVNGIVLMATFFGCRIAWGFYQCYWLYFDAWNAWNAGPKDLAYCEIVMRLKGEVASGAGCKVPAWLLLLYVVGNTVLNVLNVYWFGKMIEALRKRFDSPASKSAEEKKKT